MMNDVDIKILGDEELMKVLNGMDYKLQHKFLKKVVRDTANKTLVKQLRRESPKRTGTLRASMGALSGKSKRSAVAFAGPRMGGKHKGFVANILEYYDGGDRYPTKDKKGRKKKRPRTPDGIRVHSGEMTTRWKGYISRTIKNNLKAAEQHFTKSIKTIIEREIKRYNKRMGL